MATAGGGGSKKGGKRGGGGGAGGGKMGNRPKPGELIFDANFESGNIGEVAKLTDAEYDLTIRHDSNNPKYRLWFYFRVRNAKKSQKVLFNITNLCKSRSLYRDGMRCAFLQSWTVRLQ